MRIGVDSYAYHRLLGEVRPGEEPPSRPPFARGYLDVVAEARRLDLDAVSIETNVMPPAAAVDLAGLLDEAGPAVQVIVAHGHPEGVEFGASPAQAVDLEAWIVRAADAGLSLMRMVAGGPRLRLRTTSAERVRGTIDALRRPVALAADRGLGLALENHADLTVDELEAVLDGLGPEAPGVCFDTTNWVRVGDDPSAAAARLADRVRMVHLKDHVATPDDGLAGPAAVVYGTGEVDLAGILDRILKAGPNTPICVEVGSLRPGADEIDMVERDVAWLRAEAARRAGATSPEED